MYTFERTKLVAFTAIIALVGLIIVIISVRSSFPELLFHGIVIVLIGVIVVLVAYAFLWERTKRYASLRLLKRKMNRLAREYGHDFSGFVDRFNSLGEFQDTAKGTMRILEFLLTTDTKGHGGLINARVKDFGQILQSPLHNFQRRLSNLYWKKKEMNYEFLSCLVKEFEGYIILHKRLYVDFTEKMARKIGLDNIPQEIKSLYSDYKDDYNQFIVAYTEFARRSSEAKLRIFSENLQKAHEL